LIYQDLFLALVFIFKRFFSNLKAKILDFSCCWYTQRTADFIFVPSVSPCQLYFKCFRYSSNVEILLIVWTKQTHRLS